MQGERECIPQGMATVHKSAWQAFAAWVGCNAVVYMHSNYCCAAARPSCADIIDDINYLLGCMQRGVLLCTDKVGHDTMVWASIKAHTNQID